MMTWVRREGDFCNVSANEEMRQYGALFRWSVYGA